MNPLLATFLRLTAIVAAGLVALLVAALLIKVVLFAAIVAALVMGGFFVYQLFAKRKARLPVSR